MKSNYLKKIFLKFFYHIFIIFITFGKRLLMNECNKIDQLKRLMKKHFVQLYKVSDNYLQNVRMQLEQT